MKITLIAGALAVALAMPLAASAQQGPPQGPAYSQPGAGQSARNHATPSSAKLHRRWMKRLGGLNLTGDQQQRIHSMIDQYSQAHPAGSPVDRGASRALRQQILGVLSGDQQSQYRQMMQQRRAAMQARRAQMNGGGGQAGPQYDQGQSPGQYGDPRYQQGPPQGDQQGPPQGYQQGPPQGYQQGPPQGYQQGPPDQGGPPEGQPPA